MFLAWVAGSGLGMEPLTQAFTPLSTKTSPRSHNIAVLQYTNRLVTPLFQFHKWDLFVLCCLRLQVLPLVVCIRGTRLPCCYFFEKALYNQSTVSPGQKSPWKGVYHTHPCGGSPSLLEVAVIVTDPNDGSDCCSLKCKIPASGGDNKSKRGI